jgi:WD40 repeat protein
MLGHTAPVMRVAFSPDGTTLASVSIDKTVRLWNVASRQPIGPPMIGHTNAVFGVAFSRDGLTMASAGLDVTVQLWDVPSRQPLGPPLIGHPDSVSVVAFSPDGTTLASGGSDKTVRLWDIGVKSWLERICRIPNRNMTQAEWTQSMGSNQPYQRTCSNLPPEDRDP